MELLPTRCPSAMPIHPFGFAPPDQAHGLLATSIIRPTGMGERADPS